MATISNPHRLRHAVSATALLLLGCIAATGCHKNHRGAGTDDSHGNFVDNSWVSAAQSCWPNLTRNGYNTDRIKRNLAHPANFRNAFPAYAAQTDANLRALVVKPIETAPPPDITRLAHSSTPVLTQNQAAAGTSPTNAVIASTDGTAPPNAFCSVQDELPAGFR